MKARTYTHDAERKAKISAAWTPERRAKHAARIRELSLKREAAKREAQAK